MKKALRLGLAIIGCIIISLFTQSVFADDGFWGSEETPLEIDWVGSGTELDLTHVDADPWKGWAWLYVKNWCGEDWGDFHLRVKETSYWPSHDMDFSDEFAPQLYINDSGTWEQVLAPVLNWSVAADGSTMDMTFYDNPIGHGDKALIKVYTDNTFWMCSWFKIGVHPTPVPEPATIALLGLGVFGLLRGKKTR